MPEEVEMLDFEAFKERYEKVPVEEYPNNVREAVPEPVVSVHLLTYNHADYIREAIESVLMQEVDFPMEIVLGDDDSSDGTREICIEYAEQHPDLIRLQLHHRENNRKLNGAPTHLFQFYYNTFQLRGRYFAILSGDDYWTDPRKLQKQVDYLEIHPECSMVYHPWVARYPSDAGLSDDALLQKRRAEGKTQRSSQYLTRVFRRSAFTFYREGMNALCEDLFMGCVVRGQGEARLLDTIRPGVYRRSDHGLWKQGTAEYRRKHRAISLMLVAQALPVEDQPEGLPDLVIGSIEDYIMLGGQMDLGVAVYLISQGGVFAALHWGNASLIRRLLVALKNSIGIGIAGVKSSLLQYAS